MGSDPGLSPTVEKPGIGPTSLTSMFFRGRSMETQHLLAEVYLLPVSDPSLLDSSFRLGFDGMRIEPQNCTILPSQQLLFHLCHGPSLDRTCSR